MDKNREKILNLLLSLQDQAQCVQSEIKKIPDREETADKLDRLIFEIQLLTYRYLAVGYDDD